MESCQLPLFRSTFRQSVKRAMGWRKSQRKAVNKRKKENIQNSKLLTGGTKDTGDDEVGFSCLIYNVVYQFVYNVHCMLDTVRVLNVYQIHCCLFSLVFQALPYPPKLSCSVLRRHRVGRCRGNRHRRYPGRPPRQTLIILLLQTQQDSST